MINGCKKLDTLWTNIVSDDYKNTYDLVTIDHIWIVFEAECTAHCISSEDLRKPPDMQYQSLEISQYFFYDDKNIVWR